MKENVSMTSFKVKGLYILLAKKNLSETSGKVVQMAMDYFTDIFNELKYMKKRKLLL